MSDVMATTDATGASSLTASSGRKDIRYEVLDMNSQGMYLCQLQQLDDAERLLTQAYSLLENDSAVSNTSHQILDQLRSTTLNNLGVVECHKGLHKQALNHLEVAQTLESQWNIHSPSVSLNICAACNALQMYDRATTAALDTIEMLRQAAKSDITRAAAAGANQGAATSPTKGDGVGDTAAIQLNPSEGENSVLWGAAWHNLAVAQLNSASGKDVSEYTNVLAIFDNAMKATRELLGWKHPMTKAVHDTYRSVRAHLREAGAFKQHHALLTAELAPITGKKPLPEPEPGMTIMATSRKHEKELHITLRGKETAGKKVVERYNAAAFPGDSTRGSVSPRNSGRSGAPRHPSPRNVGIPLSGNLLSASALYRNPHPLLLHPRTENLVEYVPKTTTGASPRKATADAIAGSSEAQQRKQPQPLQASHGISKQSSRSGGGGGGRSGDGFADDMWVEAVGHSSPRPQGQGAGSGGGQGSQRVQVRPLYSQQLYALDGAAPANEHRVAQPLSTAQLDAKAAGPNTDFAPPPQ